MIQKIARATRELPLRKLIVKVKQNCFMSLFQIDSSVYLIKNKKTSESVACVYGKLRQFNRDNKEQLLVVRSMKLLAFTSKIFDCLAHCYIYVVVDSNVS